VFRKYGNNNNDNLLLSLIKQSTGGLYLNVGLHNIIERISVGLPRADTNHLQDTTVPAGP